MDLLGGALTIIADYVALGHLALARLQEARGDRAGALTTVEAFLEFAHQRGFAEPLLGRGMAARARLALAQGDRRAALAWAEASGLHRDDEPDYPREAEYLTLARLWIAQGRDDPAGPDLQAARALLARWLRHAEAGARGQSAIEIGLLQALVLDAQGHGEEAITTLGRALARGEPEGYVRLFADEGAPMAALLARLLA